MENKFLIVSLKRHLMMKPRLQGVVLDIERTGEIKKDKKGRIWEKCIFTIEITNFSKRTPHREVPEGLKGKKVKLVRWCTHDWHYKKGVKKTLDVEETDALLKNLKTDTIYW
ncbi:MAG TPA: hypothetical protein ENF41_00735 [Candidatus Bathyarchaeota archaeon]|nr:hypothetical protein [Candidatus Bathyarchaeota archaeon]